MSEARDARDNSLRAPAIVVRRAETRDAAAITLYRSFGFEVEGTARHSALHDGEFVDALMMARRSRATMAR